MRSSHRAAQPRLLMNSFWDELTLDGARVYGVRPRSRCWSVLEFLMRRAPRAVSTEELYSICARPDARDPKNAVHNVIRRLREALVRGHSCGGLVIETCETGGWQVVLPCEVTRKAPNNVPSEFRADRVIHQMKVGR